MLVSGQTYRISIHTLRVEGDGVTDDERKQLLKFQSTPSVWRVTTNWGGMQGNAQISIHTLRVEGDRIFIALTDNSADFNPHPPCGG